MTLTTAHDHGHGDGRYRRYHQPRLCTRHLQARTPWPFPTPLEAASVASLATQAQGQGLGQGQGQELRHCHCHCCRREGGCQPAGSQPQLCGASRTKSPSPSRCARVPRWWVAQPAPRHPPRRRRRRRCALVDVHGRPPRHWLAAASPFAQRRARHSDGRHARPCCTRRTATDPRPCAAATGAASSTGGGTWHGSASRQQGGRPCHSLGTRRFVVVEPRRYCRPWQRSGTGRRRLQARRLRLM